MHLPQKKRGRPRRNRQTIDKGTEELQQKRQKLLKKSILQDTSFAESLLGIFYVRQLISHPLYEAGCFFGELGYLYKPCLGYAFRQHTHGLTLKFEKCRQDRDSFLSEHQEEKRTKAWRGALQTLKQEGSAPYQVVLKVVFYDHDLYTDPFPHSLVREIKSLRKGLERLDVYFKGALRDRRGKPFDSAQSPLRSTTFPPFSKELPPLSLPGYLVQEHHSP